MEKIKIMIVNGIIFFKANIDGSLIIDTGSIKSTFNSTYFNNHKNCVIKEKEVSFVINGQTVTQKYPVGSIIIDKLCNNDYEFKSYSASVLDLSYVEKPLKSLDDSIKILGTLGMDFVSKHKITINYKDNYMVIDSNENIEGRKSNLDFSTKKHPLVKVEINNNLYKFILDTGASNCACDNSYLEQFIKKAPENETSYFIAKDLKVFGLTYSNLNMVHLDMTRMSDG